MPLPNPSDFADRQAFVSACMSAQADEDKPQNQKLAICFDRWRRKAADDLAKAASAMTFDEVRDVAAVQREVAAVMTHLHELFDVLRSTISSVMFDDEVTDKRSLVDDAFVDFGVAVANALSGSVIDEDAEEVSMALDVVKVDEDERLVFGFFSVAEKDGKPVADLEDDVVPPAELERAAYDFVLNARVAGDRHVRLGVGDLVESVVFTPEKEAAIIATLKAYGVDDPVVKTGVTAWWGGFHVTDDDVWGAVKSGDFPAFSIGGRAVREELA